MINWFWLDFPGKGQKKNCFLDYFWITEIFLLIFTSILNRSLPQNWLEMKKKYFTYKTAKFSYQFLSFYFVIMEDKINGISQNKKWKLFNLKCGSKVVCFSSKLKFGILISKELLFYYVLLLVDKKVADFWSALNVISLRGWQTGISPLRTQCY